MSLIIGKLHTEYLDPPPDGVDDFVLELMWRYATSGYMSGEGRLWAAFSDSQLMRDVEEYANDNALSQDDRNVIEEWIETLPWDVEHDDERWVELYFFD